MSSQTRRGAFTARIEKSVNNDLMGRFRQDKSFLGNLLHPSRLGVSAAGLDRARGQREIAPKGEGVSARPCPKSARRINFRLRRCTVYKLKHQSYLSHAQERDSIQLGHITVPSSHISRKTSIILSFEFPRSFVSIGIDHVSRSLTHPKEKVSIFKLC